MTRSCSRESDSKQKILECISPLQWWDYRCTFNYGRQTNRDESPLSKSWPFLLDRTRSLHQIFSDDLIRNERGTHEQRLWVTSMQGNPCRKERYLWQAVNYSDNINGHFRYSLVRSLVGPDNWKATAIFYLTGKSTNVLLHDLHDSAWPWCTVPL